MVVNCIVLVFKKQAIKPHRLSYCWRNRSPSTPSRTGYNQYQLAWNLTWEKIHCKSLQRNLVPKGCEKMDMSSRPCFAGKAICGDHLYGEMISCKRMSVSILHVCMLSHFSRVWLCDPMDCSLLQAPLSMGFSRQEYWSGLPCPPPGDHPDSGIEPRSLISPARAGGFFTTSTTRQAPWTFWAIPKPSRHFEYTTYTHRHMGIYNLLT